MLSKLIALSVRHRAIVLIVTALLIVMGIAALLRLPFDAFPDTTPVQVTVNVTAPALSPLEVERQLTYPLEQSIAGLPGLTTVRSLSRFGFSQITAIFEDGTDIYLARQVVTERISGVALPGGVNPPSLGPVSTGLGEVFQYLVESESLSPRELRTLHHWVIRPQLVQVPGIAEINTWGGFEKQYHVIVEPQRLLAHGLTLDAVATALADNNMNVGGGITERGGEASILQGIGLATGVEDLRNIVIAAVDGIPVRIEDVAKVEIGDEIRRGAVTAEGRGEAVLGLGFMLMGENSREVTRLLETRLAEVQASLPEEVTLTPVYSRTELVDQVLATVEKNLLEGALLVVAVLFVFLGNLRAGLIVALAIPLSMLFAFDAMLRFGIAGSLMSLGAIDFGLVVDSSVIMVENAARRVSEDKTGRSIPDIVTEAALEVRRPTLFGELIIAVVYLPILTLEGIEGKMFRPMALTVLFALLGSMILSVTVMPALASFALKRGGEEGDSRLMRILKGAYRPALLASLRHRWVVLGSAALILINVAFLATTLGSEFIPRLREQAIVVNTVRLASVGLSESVRYGTRIETYLKERFPDEIAHIWTRTGTAEVATDPMGMEVSDVFITLTPRERWRRGATQDELMAQVATELEVLPGMRSILTQPIEMRLNEMIAGIRSDIAIKLFGDDFEILKEQAEAIRLAVAAIPGAADVSVEQLTGLPIQEIVVDRDAIARAGLSVRAVLEVVESLGSRQVGEVVEGQRRFPLVLRLPEAYRDDPEALQRLSLPAPDGQLIPLGTLAKVRTVTGPSAINREWAKRRIAIQANVRGRDLGSFVGEVREVIAAQIDLPSGYFVTYGGQFENLERAQERLMLVVPLALLLVFALLYLTFGDTRDALLVFTGVPFAAVGGIAALWLRGMPFSISAAVGFIAVSGVSVLGQLVLVSRARQLSSRGMDTRDATFEAALSRLRPVLMTALVAALGFVPMALNTGVGAEVQRPLATVVIGGIVTSLMATLILLPVLYSAFGSGEEGEGEGPDEGKGMGEGELQTS